MTSTQENTQPKLLSQWRNWKKSILVPVANPRKMKRDKGESREEEKKSGMEEHFDIADLDTESARKLLGSDKLFWTVLREYYKNIPGKSKKIRDFVDSEDWANYTIEVHSLKSSSRHWQPTVWRKKRWL